ncbi:carboxypeptidase regulatory-like domain-containing protein [Hyalangium versicolor]|uniref:carboxypeptidase regulatory-like domain-containing protein n=1 Tax=Hyalangium versicolor TaxID=2861190 RepID=UPI001CCE366A|nr:carboxypeptidase regulatory-like domain-containing protein [Hyalangium versicolor]
MRKLIIVAAALLGAGLVLLLLWFSGGADTDTGRDESPQERASAKRADTRTYRERPEDVGVRGNADAGSTPSLVEPPSEAEGVLELEVLAGGNPVPGASARLYWRGPRDPNLNEVSWRLASTGVTNEQGRARLAARPGSYLVAVRAAGYAPLLRDVTRPHGEANTLLRLTLERGQALVGRTVVQGSKEPVPLVELSLTLYGSPAERGLLAEAPAEERINASSNPRGDFRVEGLTPGDYQLEARAPGYTRAILRRVKVPSASPLMVELQAAGVIEGFVVDAQGQPAAGAEVLVSGRVPEVTTTGSGGGFSVEVEAGSHTVSARRGNEAGALDKPLVISPGKTVREVRIQLGQSAVLRGKVLARGTGSPVPGARVDVSPYGSSGDCGRAVTDDAGLFSVEGLAPGSYDLVVSASGFATLSRRALTVSSGDQFPVELQLAGTGAVEGSVRDSTGQPVARAQVVSNSRWGDAIDSEARTDAEGHYRLEELPAGSLSITVRREGDSLGKSQLVEVVGGDTAQLDFSLEDTGTVEGVVRTGQGSLPEEALVVLAYPRNKGFLPTDFRPVEVDATGAFRMTLQPGSYELRARLLDQWSFGNGEATPVEVLAGQTVRVELAWNGDARETDRLQGVVLEPDGMPSPEAFVMVSPPDQALGSRASASADAQGRFSMALPSRVATSPSRLKLVARNGGRTGELLDVRPGEQQVVVRLRPAASLRGRVVRAGGGAPVKGFSLTLQSQNLQDFPLGNGTWEFPGERFELRDVSAEPMRLLVRTTDGQGGEALVSPSAGAETEVEIRLKGTARVRGRVVDAVTQEPIAGALVLIVEDRPLDPDKATGTDGRFLLEGVATGQRLLLVISGKDSERMPVSLEEGQDLDVGDVRLGPRSPQPENPEIE